MGLRNSAATDLSLTDLQQTITLRICLFTACHVSTSEPDAPSASTVVRLWTGLTLRVISAAF